MFIKQRKEMCDVSGMRFKNHCAQGGPTEETISSFPFPGQREHSIVDHYQQTCDMGGPFKRYGVPIVF
jgi:hypothetical protein